MTPRKLRDLVEVAILRKLQANAPVRESEKLIFPASAMGKCPRAILAETAGAEPVVPVTLDSVSYAYMGHAVHQFIESALSEHIGYKFEVERRLVSEEERLAATFDLLIYPEGGKPIAIEIKSVKQIFSAVPRFWMMQLAAQELVLPDCEHFLLQVCRVDGSIDVLPVDASSSIPRVREMVSFLVECIESFELPVLENPPCEYCIYYPCVDLDWNRILEILRDRLEASK